MERWMKALTTSTNCAFLRVNGGCTRVHLINTFPIFYD